MSRIGKSNNKKQSFCLKKLQVQKLMQCVFVYRLMHKRLGLVFNRVSFAHLLVFNRFLERSFRDKRKKWSWNENLESLRFLFRVLGTDSKIWFPSTFQIPAMKLLALTVVWMSLLISGTTSYRRFVQISDIHMVSGSLGATNKALGQTTQKNHP